MAQDNVDLIETAWQAFGRGDIEEATKLATEGTTISIPETLPWGGTYTGSDAFQQFLPQVFDQFDDFKVVPEKVLGADDDHVVVVVHATGRTKSGKSFDGRAVWVYRLRDGKVVEAEQFVDTAMVREALA